VDWFNELTAKLPRRNDAEPPGLREQIVAELRDHLECDFRREMITAENEQAAWQRVHNKFGNPAEVALRLWLDAMKGKLIMQKLSVAFLTALVCLCLVMIGFMWNNFSAQADMQRESLDEIKNLIAILPAAEENKPTGEEQYSGDWRKLSLTLEAKDGSSDGIFKITVKQDFGQGGGNSLSENFEMKVGETHETGTFPPGYCTVSVQSPWSESFLKQIILGPGRENNLKIIAPSNPAESGKIDFKLSFSDKNLLAEKDRILVQALISDTKPRKYEEDIWYHQAYQMILTFNNQGKLIEIQDKQTHLTSGFPSNNLLNTLVEGKFSYRGCELIVTSICLAKFTPTETHTDQYQYSEPFRFAAPEKHQRLASKFVGGNSLFLENLETHVTIAPNGKNAIEATSLIVQPSTDNVIQLKIPDLFTEWCKDKNKFTDTCSYFNLYGASGFF